MRTRIQRWGNSLALRIPKSFALETQLEQGSSVDVSLIDGKLLISPVIETEPTLEQLLAHVTKKNIHQEIDTGPTTGSEEW